MPNKWDTGPGVITNMTFFAVAAQMMMTNMVDSDCQTSFCDTAYQ